MNKNRLSILLIAVVLFVGGFFATSSGIAQAVQIPEQVNLFVTGLTIAAVSAGFAWLFDFTGLDLRGWATELGVVFASWVVMELQEIVNLIPASFDPYVSFVFQVLVVLLSGAGALYVLAKQRGSRELLA